MRGGLPPLDFDTVAAEAMSADYGDVEFPIAGLRSIVGFKRLAGRPRDRDDLIGLEEIHGELPVDPIPGVEDRSRLLPARRRLDPAACFFVEELFA